MKKKWIMLIAVSMLAVLLAACGKDSKDSADDQKDGTTLEDLESYLLDEGVLSGEKAEVDAELMRAEDGVKYADSNVEIYEYDINSDTYNSLAEGASVGFDNAGPFSAKAVNGKYVLIATGEVSQELVDAFKNFDK